MAPSNRRRPTEAQVGLTTQERRWRCGDALGRRRRDGEAAARDDAEARGREGDGPRQRSGSRRRATAGQRWHGAPATARHKLEDDAPERWRSSARVILGLITALPLLICSLAASRGGGWGKEEEQLIRVCRPGYSRRTGNVPGPL
ncbi:hypothetical protein E2562_013526 [Oryza meyeriana var. granulata]|uniref:Uncharacterized protein n=1 Tax=Oryza meyeriana var. granulata TaxID=110450 RepID=A0A6G1BVY2_9ORYZ|nr:hypothetical protein E2562_013526 [Oryza meyeriana var. granulata]